MFPINQLSFNVKSKIRHLTKSTIFIRLNIVYLAIETIRHKKEAQSCYLSVFTVKSYNIPSANRIWPLS
jgi:hypothetical protein